MDNTASSSSSSLSSISSHSQEVLVSPTTDFGSDVNDGGGADGLESDSDDDSDGSSNADESTANDNGDPMDQMSDHSDSNSNSDDGLPDFDANQARDERRKLQREMRMLLRKMNADENKFLDPEADVLQVLDESERLLVQSRQTTEVAMDASVVIRLSELSYRRTAQFLADRTTHTGIDLEDFIIRSVDYMRYGRGVDDVVARRAELSRMQRRRRRIEARTRRCNDSDNGGNVRGALPLILDLAQDAVMEAEAGSSSDELDETEADERVRRRRDAAAARRVPLHDWAHLGKYACLPLLRRPALARFLPCSERPGRSLLRAQAAAQAVARRRMAALDLQALERSRPQVLGANDMGNGPQTNDLTKLAAGVLAQLEKTIARAQAEVAAGQTGADAIGLWTGEDEDGDAADKAGIDLMRFALNTYSFGQTVENVFYISFLVRDGRVGLAMDKHGLPVVYPTGKEVDSGTTNGKEESDKETQKNQLVISLDVPTWQEMIELYGSGEPMIGHRAQANAHPTARAWFS